MEVGDWEREYGLTDLIFQNVRMDFFRDDQYLEIRSIQERDAANYTCLAENVAGTARQELELDVLGRSRQANAIDHHHHHHR